MSPSRKKTALVVIVVLILVMLFFVFKNSFFRPHADTEDYKSPTTSINDPSHPDFDTVENGIHLRTGFVEGDGLQLVINNCTTCHSAKLVTQNRMSKEQWKATIRWMQETQNLWDLGENEGEIVDYLATHYAPTQKGRRQNLADVEWYTLDTEY